MHNQYDLIEEFDVEIRDLPTTYGEPYPRFMDDETIENRVKDRFTKRSI